MRFPDLLNKVEAIDQQITEVDGVLAKLLVGLAAGAQPEELARRLVKEYIDDAGLPQAGRRPAPRGTRRST